MIRVLIAEDELPILRGIKRMVEKLNPQFDVVCLAKNGQEAIRYMEEHPVDVVFTDINMPVCDGIAVMRYISENHAHMHSVVISGYNEFNYVKEAIKYGAKNYILKPVDEKELTELLAMLEQKIMKSDHEQKKQLFFDALFFPKQVSKEECLSPHTFVMYVCIGSFPMEVSEEAMFRELPFGEIKLLNFFDRMLGDSGVTWVYHAYSVSEYAVVLQLKEPEQIQFIAEQVLINTTTNDELPVTVIISEEVTQTSKMYHVYNQLRRQMYEYAPFGKSSVIRGSKSHSDDFVLEKTVDDRIVYAVRKGNYLLLRDEVVQLKDKLSQFQPSQKKLKYILDHIMIIIKRNSEVYKQDLTEYHVNELLTNCFDYDSLFDDFLVICKNMLNNNEFDTRDKEDLMRKVEQYINSNIHLNLSSKILSQRFGLVAPYLSKLFKEYKGESPAQYIQNIRIDLAKKMLVENPSLLSKDISEIIGYNDSLYFSKTFKKNVGVYPSEYRLYALSEK